MKVSTVSICFELIQLRIRFLTSQIVPGSDRFKVSDFNSLEFESQSSNFLSTYLPNLTKLGVGYMLNRSCKHEVYSKTNRMIGLGTGNNNHKPRIGVFKYIDMPDLGCSSNIIDWLYILGSATLSILGTGKYKDSFCWLLIEIYLEMKGPMFISCKWIVYEQDVSLLGWLYIQNASRGSTRARLRLFGFLYD